MTWIRGKCFGKSLGSFPRQSERRSSGIAASQLITDDPVNTTRMAHAVEGEEAPLPHSS